MYETKRFGGFSTTWGAFVGKELKGSAGNFGEFASFFVTIV